MARKIPSLGRFLGAPSLYAMAYGEISSSLYYALGITAVYALSLTPIVFLAAGLLFALAAAAYAEGGATIPEPGGSSALSRRAWGDLAGFIAGWATVLDFVIAISLSALFLPHYAAGAFGSRTQFSVREAAALAVAILGVVTVVRLVWRTDAYSAGVAVAALDLVVQVSLAVLGLALLFSWSALTHGIDVGTVPTWNALAFSFPIAMIGYTGLEKVSSVAAYAKDPERSVPDSVRSSVFTVVIVYAAVATAAASAFPTIPDRSVVGGHTGLGRHWVNAPMLGLANRIGAHGPTWVHDGLVFGVGMTACAILLMAILTSFSGCGRLAESMGRHDQLPAVFGRTSRRLMHPPAAIVGVGLLAIGFIVVGALYRGQEELTLASLYSFGILIAFMMTQASVVWLRIVAPDIPRPFLMKGNMWIRGRLIPITSVVGTVLAFIAWVVALGTHPGARVVGPLWMVAGLRAVRRRARPGRPADHRERRAGCAAAPGRHRDRVLHHRRPARAPRRDRRGDDGVRLPAGGRRRGGGGRSQRPLRARPRADRQADARTRARGGGGAGARGVAGRRIRRRVQGGGLAHAQPRAAGRRRGRRIRRTADHGGIAVQAPPRPQPARGVLRRDGRFHPPQGPVQGDRDPLPGRGC